MIYTHILQNKMIILYIKKKENKNGSKCKVPLVGKGTN